MNLIDLIMRLLYEFVPMEQGEYAKMKDEAKQWYISIRTDDEANLAGGKLAVSKFKRVAELWYMRAFWAIMYIYGKRQLTLYTNPTFLDKKGDEEED